MGEKVAPLFGIRESWHVEGTPRVVYAHTFRLAREARGLSRRGAARASVLALRDLRAIERGERAPRRDELAALAALYDYPVAFFERLDTAESDDPIFVCGDYTKTTPSCSRCGAFAFYRCDYPMGAGKTCDLALCGRCRVRVAGEPDEDDDPAGIDYCPQHVLMAGSQETR